MTVPSASRVARRFTARVVIPDPYKMTKAEFLRGTPEPKPRPGYQLLYHTTSPRLAVAEGIAQHGLLTKHSKSPPKGWIWASTKPDDFYGNDTGTLIIFQVPKRGSEADQDPYNFVEWDVGSSVTIGRDIDPKDIVAIDPIIKTDGFGRERLSFFRDRQYAETYWDEWFGPQSKGRSARHLVAGMKLPSDLPDDTFVNIATSGDTLFVEYTQADGRSTPNIGEGVLEAEQLPDCNDHWSVVSAGAPHGWGPMLYDVAMEYVQPDGLMADRGDVSRAALRVWMKYQRRSDVEEVPISGNIYENAPEDCQPMGILAPEVLYSAFLKKPKLIPQLKQLGKLLINGKPA